MRKFNGFPPWELMSPPMTGGRTVLISFPVVETLYKKKHLAHGVYHPEHCFRVLSLSWVNACGFRGASWSDRTRYCRVLWVGRLKIKWWRSFG